MTRRALLWVALMAIASALPLAADGPPIEIHRTSAPITIDGDLSDPGWKDATRVDQWWETNPGDNTEPKAKSVGYLAYDDHFFYAGFQFLDPDPSKIQGPFNDRDHIGGNTDDYGGVILDTRNDGKTGILFLVNPRNIQYDSVNDDSSGNEDSSPDFFWDSATKINAQGWTLEIRIPFSTLRYKGRDPQFGIMLYRNWPRERRYQMFANKIPRGSNCFICNENKLLGLQNLPPGGHMVAAPYVTAKSIGEAPDGVGSRIVTRPVKVDGGVDVKWTPTPTTALDATVNPDFSQIESDTAVISTNERFAIFFPEKRPFFLEGSELFLTPVQAVYTRSITSPRWGLRSTGKFGQNAYTLLIAQDRGGGTAILPSPVGSNFADQEFSAKVAIGRMRHDFGKSFISFLGTARVVPGGAHNFVGGPDFQWKTEHETITGQLLLSDTRTPNRPDLATEWNGQSLRSYAGDLWYAHSSSGWDFWTEYKDFGDKFRADSGFVPQVGFRSTYAELGRTNYPKDRFFSRFRSFMFAEYDSDQKGAEIYRLVSIGFGADGKFQSFNRWRVANEKVRAGDRLFERNQLLYSTSWSINRYVPQVGADGWIGQQVDFANVRLGRGASFSPYFTVRPTNHLETRLSAGVQWLNENNGTGSRNRLFTSQVERLRATYTFSSKMFLRTILQNERTNRNQSLYTYAVSQHGGDFATQLLFAYKLNWQTLIYLGYGDLRAATADEGNLVPSNRQFFFKVSYAFQR